MNITFSNGILAKFIECCARINVNNKLISVAYHGFGSCARVAIKLSNELLGCL